MRPHTAGFIGAAALLAALSCPAWAQQQTVDSATFVRQAAASNQFEIDSSQIALDKAESKKVKTFAREMIKDHEKAGKQFEAAVNKAGLKAPAPNEIETQLRPRIDPLNTSGQFDQDYVDAQLQAHEDAVSLFTEYSRSGDNPDLKAFASKTLPVLKRHLGQVQKLAHAGGGKAK